MNAGVFDVHRVIEQRMLDSDAVFVIAREGDRRVGIGSELPAREHDGMGPDIVPGLMHVSMIAVDPQHWGRGIGKAITEYCISRAMELGFTSIQLWTHVSNERAQRLYKSLAFQAGREKTDERGENIRLYVRHLTGAS